MKSKTQQALDWRIANPDQTDYAAAKLFKISQSAISRARKSREGKQICPCCNQIIRKGKKES